MTMSLRDEVNAYRLQLVNTDVAAARLLARVIVALGPSEDAPHAPTEAEWADLGRPTVEGVSTTTTPCESGSVGGTLLDARRDIEASEPFPLGQYLPE